MALTPGTRIGPYEILALIGAGGMGEVYRARDAKLARAIALKILPGDVASDAERRHRFEQEARAASSLNHPSIVHVYDVGSSDSIHYIAMELVDGKNLRNVLASGPLPTKKLLEMAIEMADGLAKAHAAGIVHRDLKPENLIVTGEGHVKILDFGLAKLAPSGSEDQADESTSPKLTRAGMVLGTLGYMSPEQASGKAVDFRSDQFSLGCILYEMASGHRAFQKTTGPETLTAILREAPEPLSRLNPLLPAPVRWIIEERCLAKDPEDRYASTRDLLRELKSARDHVSDASTDSATPSARSRRKSWSAPSVAFVAGVLLAMGVVHLIGQRSGRAEPPAFRQISFGRGTIWSARFAPDGETILYGAAWDGRPVEPFLTRVGGPEVRALGVPGAEILAISSLGEIAISLERRYVGGWQFSGTLARMALTGDSPRPTLDDVQYADWSPDGKSLAVLRVVGGKSRLEYPIGTVLFETASWLSHLRVSPRGDRVAFFDHPLQGDDRGTVCVVDRSGNRKTLSEESTTEQGLAWSPTGEEVWFTAARSGNVRALRAVTLAGIERTVAAVPGTLTLHDVSKDGRVLLGREWQRTGIRGVLPGSDQDRDVSALDYSIPVDLSPDGGSLLIAEQGEGAPTNYSIYLRRPRTNSALMLLGEGQPLSFSPDGMWILGFLPTDRRQLMLVPTGAGDIRRLQQTGLTYDNFATILPDGKRLVCRANETGHAARLYVQDLEGGQPRPISPEGVSPLPLAAHPVSPDGTRVAATGPDDKLMLYPIEDGGTPRAIVGAEPGDIPTRFGSDGRSLFVFRREALPARIFRIDLATGRRSLWKEIAPSDPAGLTRGVRVFAPTADGKFYIYSVNRILSELYLAQGLH